jgi:hypothetical protein
LYVISGQVPIVLRVRPPSLSERAISMLVPDVGAGFFYVYGRHVPHRAHHTGHTTQGTPHRAHPTTDKAILSVVIGFAKGVYQICVWR